MHSYRGCLSHSMTQSRWNRHTSFCYCTLFWWKCDKTNYPANVWKLNALLSSRNYGLITNTGINIVCIHVFHYVVCELESLSIYNLPAIKRPQKALNQSSLFSLSRREKQRQSCLSCHILVLHLHLHLCNHCRMLQCCSSRQILEWELHTPQSHCSLHQKSFPPGCWGLGRMTRGAKNCSMAHRCQIQH